MDKPKITDNQLKQTLFYDKFKLIFGSSVIYPFVKTVPHIEFSFLNSVTLYLEYLQLFTPVCNNLAKTNL